MKEVLIEKAVARAKKLPEGVTKVIGIDTPDGMVARIEYHTTASGTNVCDDWRLVTSEHWDWERAGCKNNEEWHRHLNREFWKSYTPGLNSNTAKGTEYENAADS